MSFSHTWRKIKRAVQRVGSGIQGSNQPHIEISIESIRVAAGCLRILVVPALPAVDFLVQLSGEDGQILLSEAVMAKAQRIVPGKPIDVMSSIDIKPLPEGISECHIDIIQGIQHVTKMFQLERRGQSVHAYSATLDEFLKIRGLVNVCPESLLPRCRSERLSMDHLSNDDFVQYCYHWLLNREADPTGLQSYTTALAGKLTRKELIIDMFNSKESISSRRLSPASLNGQASYPFSVAHDRMRLALGVLTN